jgi:peptide deformylase
MSKMQVYALPNMAYYTTDFVLRKKCRDIAENEIREPWFQSLVSDMFETLYADPSGVGLAAPQVGMSIRLVVIDVKRDAKKPIVLINPTYEAIDEEKVESSESCLSVPFHTGKIMRYKSVKVKALDYTGNPIELIGEKFLSNVFQHEIDHLDGILYIDRMPSLEQLETNLGYANLMAKKAIKSFESKDV